MEQNLPELRDIHLPEGVSTFPPAYGWWVILGGILLLLLLTDLFLIVRRKSKKRYALYLLAHVRQENAVAAALQMSEILRRICVYKYKEAAALYGQPWLDFLNRHAKIKLEGASARLLLDAPYMNPASPGYAPQDVETLRRFSAGWIGENL